MTLPPYPHYPELTGEKIRLRAVQPTDISSIVAISFYDSVPAQSVAEAAAMQARIDQDYQAGESIHWAITALATGKIVGTCGFHRGFEKGVGELGCVMLPEFREQGLMAEALRLAVGFGVKTAGLRGIRAITTLDNFPAIELLERLGFQPAAGFSAPEIEYHLPADSPAAGLLLESLHG